MNLFNKNKKISILIVSGSCCMPQMAPVEAQVRQVVEQVVAEECPDAVVRTMSVTEAFYGGLPRAMIQPFMEKFNRTGEISLPAVLVNGELTTTGIPDLGRLRAALRNAQVNSEVASNV